MNLRIEIEVSEQDLILLRENSLERVLQELMRATTHGDLLTVKQEVGPLQSMAAQLWFVASSAAIVQRPKETRTSLPFPSS